MYWPIGTPRIYATSSSRAPAFKLVLSNDGLSSPSESTLAPSPALSGIPSRRLGHDDIEIQPPPTPLTPMTPAVQSVEYDDYLTPQQNSDSDVHDSSGVPLKDPLLALRVSRSGQLFAVITSTSITVWQAKVGDDTNRRWHKNFCIDSHSLP